VDPRIETAEILAFRLKVSPADLEKLPQELGAELHLSVEEDAGELIVSMAEAESYLRFRPIGREAMLTEIFLCNDDRGMFFQRVLGALMVRHRGDLHIRLTWNQSDRNSHGEFAEVRINRGATTYPGLSAPLNALPAPRARSRAAKSGGSAPGEAMEGAAPGDVPEPTEPHDPASDATQTPTPTPGHTALEREVQEILARARRHWDEYQRLKAAKKRT
jgi:hypothetical protein